MPLGCCALLIFNGCPNRYVWRVCRLLSKYYFMSWNSKEMTALPINSRSLEK
jgi:hypothetical protein